MGQKFKLDDQEYDVDNLSDQTLVIFSQMQFASIRIKELTNMKALLQRAKISYIESLKREMISQKTGLLLSDD
jgi:hypothetical protein